MSCVERETALLMLIHGEVKGISKWSLRLHMLFCRDCRARLAGFYGISQNLATNLENPRLGVRRIVLPSVIGVIGVILGVVTLSVVIAGLLATWLGSSDGTGSCPTLPPARQNSAQKIQEVKSSSNLSGQPCD